MTVGPLPAALDPGQPDVDSAGLGRLMHVAQPLEVWLTEAGHFTPWLADNLDVLAEEMGLSLTLTATEVPVGEFRLDIKAETADGRVVISENQLDARPNDWQKHVKAVAGGGPQPVITPLNEVRQEFFLEALTEIVLTKPGIRIPSKQSANWLSFASGPFGYWAISVAQDRRIQNS